MLAADGPVASVAAGAEPGTVTTATGTVRVRVVLFVDISSSTRLYKNLGDAEAVRRIRTCLRELCQITEAHDGRVIKNMGDGLMCDFAVAEQALVASEAMQTTVSGEYGRVQPNLSIHVGCHLGHVIESEGDLFGDTVNIAARIANIAGSGKIITTQQTADALPPPLRVRVRPLQQVSVKGHSDTVAVCEYLWGEYGDATILGGPALRPASEGARLRVVCGQDEVWLDRRSTPHSILLGRQPGCELTVTDPSASRQHATIELRGDKFVVVDHSANGTYVAWETTETCLKREEMILPSRGRLGLGSSTSTTGITLVVFSHEF